MKKHKDNSLDALAMRAAKKLGYELTIRDYKFWRAGFTLGFFKNLKHLKKSC